MIEGVPGNFADPRLYFSPDNRQVDAPHGVVPWLYAPSDERHTKFPVHPKETLTLVRFEPVTIRHNDQAR